MKLPLYMYIFLKHRSPMSFNIITLFTPIFLKYSMPPYNNFSDYIQKIKSVDCNNVFNII